MAHNPRPQPPRLPDVSYEQVFEWGSFGQTDAALEAYDLGCSSFDYPDTEHNYHGVDNLTITLATPQELGFQSGNMVTAESFVDKTPDTPVHVLVTYPQTREQFVAAQVAKYADCNQDSALEVLQYRNPGTEAETIADFFDEQYTEVVIDSVADAVTSSAAVGLTEALRVALRYERQARRRLAIGNVAYIGALMAGESPLFSVNSYAGGALEAVTGLAGTLGYVLLHGRARARARHDQRLPKDGSSQSALVNRVANEIAESIRGSYSYNWNIAAELDAIIAESDIDHRD